MSIAFDSFWWWRTEFDGRPNTSQSHTAPVTNNSTGSVATIQGGNVGDGLDTSTILSDNVYDVFSSNDDLSNWHWPAALNFED